MTVRALVRTGLLSAAFVLATMVLGWWAPALVGAAWGFLARARSVAAREAGFAALIGWGALLLWTAVHAPVTTLLQRLGAIMRIPPALLVLTTLVLAGVLAWSAAAVARVSALGLQRLSNPRG